MAARRSLVRHPELWLYALAACAGLALALGIVAPDAAPADHAHHQHQHHHHAPTTTPLGSWLVEWRGWIVMVLAMMLPIVAPHARRIAMRSLWHRRHRAIASFLAGYLAVWLSVGAILVGVLVAVGGTQPGPALLAAALLAAAAWQVARPRRRVMRRCGTLRPGAARGWQADRDCTEAGVRIGLRCTFTCGPAMLAMAVGHSLALMAGLLALLLTERARGPNPELRAGRPLEAWCLVAFAAVAGLVATA
ncbi:MAG TPA: DUF2182 domain-containing protein [Thermoleophilaceae bacterium]|nr:DUF2182 domain-containing protein [Thermoleophilaceae bacterium]